MSYLSFKAKTESLFVPLAKPLNMNPSIITLLSIFIMLYAAIIIATEASFLFGALLVLVVGLLDVLDGVVAKTHKLESKFGAFFDRTADRINDGLMILAVIAGAYVDLYLGLAVLFLVILASYMSACIEAMTKTKIGEAMSMRPVRTGIFIAGCLGMVYYSPLSLQYAFYALLFIAIYSVIGRLIAALRFLK